MNFCSHCGERLILAEVDGKERHKCPNCGRVHYLDPKVACCTIPVLDGRVVLLQRNIDPQRGKWVFPGGYMDRGETVHEAAVRETEEEVGLRVRLGDVIGIYSYRTSPVVVIVFRCDVIAGEVRINDHESMQVGLFREEEIPWKELAFPSTRQALRDFFALNL